MTLLILGLVVFFSSHLVSAAPALRQRLIGALGANGYRGAYSFVSIAGVALIAWGWSVAPFVSVWEPPAWGRHATLLLMLLAFPLLVASGNPGQLKRIIAHPMILAVKVWALAHLFVRGDLASLILFGSFLAWGVFALISMKRRERAGLITVAVGPWRNDVIAVGVGLALYIAFVIALHGWLIGIDLTP
ncbi:MAG: NnrU family protein [Rhizobiales bacterium]|nr:NnrU family protein [Hyphomicrobiales bacterium]